VRRRKRCRVRAHLSGGLAARYDLRVAQVRLGCEAVYLASTLTIDQAAHATSICRRELHTAIRDRTRRIKVKCCVAVTHCSALQIVRPISVIS
jgi:hypothetical protein